MKRVRLWFWIGISICMIGLLYAGVTLLRKKTTARVLPHVAIDQSSEEDKASEEDSSSQIASHYKNILIPQGRAANPVSLRPLIIPEEGLLLATTLAKTGESALIGKPLSDGLFLYLNKLNSEQGGINGKYRVSLDLRDDKGKVTNSLLNLVTLMKKTQLFFSPLGDEVFIKGVAPLFTGEHAAILFPVAGYRPPLADEAPIMFFRPSYTEELYTLVNYALSVIKQNRIVVFYEDSIWGQAGKKAVEKIMEHCGTRLVGSASYQAGTVNVGAAIKEILNLAPQVVICIANGRPAYNFIREAVNQKLHYVTYLGISRLAGIQEHLMKARGIQLITSSVVPNPNNSMLEIVKEYRSDMQKFLPNKGLSAYSLEGYINSALLVHALKNLPLTATIGDLFASFLTLKNTTFKGLHLNCANSTLSHTIWINDGRESEWQAYTIGS